MNIVVCVKIIQGELNPFDECALEVALSLPESNVTVISMGPITTAPKLKMLTRLGVGRVILVSDSAFAGSDTLATAYILSKCIGKLKFDAIFCGRQSIDGDTAQVGSCLAATLGITPVTNIMKAIFTSSTYECETRIGDFSGLLPALFTFERINTLRFPSIRSKEQEIEIWDNGAVGADISRCGLAGSPTKVLQVFESTVGRRKCHFVDKAELNSIIEEIRRKPKNNIAVSESKIKLPEVWAIGHEVCENAHAVSEKVVVIDETDPYIIAELIKKQKPAVVLWNADILGRKNAPIAAALLHAGLCADCTALETDGNQLFMYRPARSGNVTAKIRCESHPCMATVRTQSQSADIIAAGGKGIAHLTKQLDTFAKKMGAQKGASRALVDCGGAPYCEQIGLTGKKVAPKLYIAIGISGAVHHIAGIENADTVIAVNPDKNAPIFEYADYGIVCKAEEIF